MGILMRYHCSRVIRHGNDRFFKTLLTRGLVLGGGLSGETAEEKLPSPLVLLHRPVVFTEIRGEMVGAVVFGDKIEIVGGSRLQHRP